MTKGSKTIDYDGFYIDRSGAKHLLEAKGRYSSLVNADGTPNPGERRSSVLW